MMLGERMKLIRESIGLSQKLFGDQLGIPQTTYANYESNKAKVPDEIKQSLASGFNINLHWLITGDGPMHYQMNGIVAEVQETMETGYSPVPVRTGMLVSPSGRIETIEVGRGEILVPILSQRLSAGPGQEWLPSDFTSERLPLLSRFIKPYKCEDVFAAPVSGDSMTGVQLFDGDIVFFVRGETTGDGIYVIAVDGEVYVKRVEVDPFDRKLIIKSENDRYQPRIVEPDRVVMMGKVIGWLHHHPY